MNSACISLVFLVEHLAICVGHHLYDGNNDNDGSGGFLTQWGLTFGVAVAFDLVTEVWLDQARMWTLERQLNSSQNQNRNASQQQQIPAKIRQAHQRRKEYHSKRTEVDLEGPSFRFPWLGTGNWHYETSHCLRDAILSMATLALYLYSQDAFAVWWMPVVWGTYTADMFVLLVRRPAIAPSWFQFVSLHHSMAGAFFASSSFLSREPLDTVVREIALIWISNVFTTGPIVYRSFFGQDHLVVWIAGILIQRALRWTGAIVAIASVSDDFTLYLFSPPYFHIGGCIALACIEVFDIQSQLGTVRGLWKRRHPMGGGQDEEEGSCKQVEREDTAMFGFSLRTICEAVPPLEAGEANLIRQQQQLSWHQMEVGDDDEDDVSETYSHSMDA